MPFGRRVTYYLRHVVAVVSVRPVRFRELFKALCIGRLHRRALQLWEMFPYAGRAPEVPKEPDQHGVEDFTERHFSRFLFRFVPYGLMVRGNGPFTLVERYDRKRKFAACHSVDALNRNASLALAGDGHVFVAAAAPAIGLWHPSHDFIGFDPAIGGSLRIIQ